MKRRRKFISVILSLAFAMVMLIGMTITANADNTPVTYIDHDADGTPRTKTCNSYTEVPNGSALPESANGWYVVKDRRVDISGRIVVSNTVNMILVNDSYLCVAGGFNVKKGATLNIYSQRGDKGQLDAVGSDDDMTAGIGIDSGDQAGTVNIHGGIVGAIGGRHAAGIGGGVSGDGGKVTIYGGHVTALGNKEGGAGIGGGNYGAGGEVTIYDGVVNASGTSAGAGTSGGAGIGGGYGGKGGKVTIYGGFVDTSGDIYHGDHGAGIGAGVEGGSDGVLILGNGVTLYGDNDNYEPTSKKGEGPGNYDGERYRHMTTTDLEPVSYQEASWDAENKKVVYEDKTAGIYTEVSGDDTRSWYGDWYGGWYVVKGENVVINSEVIVNGTVNLILCDGAQLTAKDGIRVPEGNRLNIYAQENGSGKLISTAGSSNGGAGIGGKNSPDKHDCGTVVIHGGKVTATGYGAAGIGGTATGNGGTVTIYGGEVKATGQGDGGAGIGSGNNSGHSSGTVTIYGGTVDANGGTNAAGIGGGNYNAGATVEIHGGQVMTRGGITESSHGMGIGAGYSVTDNGSLTVADGLRVLGGTTEANMTVIEKSGVDYPRYQFMSVGSHTHDFTYTASGDTITAACSVAHCTLPDSKATLKITKPQHETYNDGEDAEAGIIDSDGIRGEAKVQYQKKNGTSYEDPTETVPTDAGDYKASITISDATASVEYTIAKADPIAKAPTGDAKYGQTLEQVSFIMPMGNTPGDWEFVEPLTKSVGDVGQHTFKMNFTPDDNANYKSVSDVDVTVRVSKADNPATVQGTAVVKVGGNEVDLSKNVTLNDAKGAVSYEFRYPDHAGCELSSDGLLTSGNTAGTVDVLVTVAADEHYEEDTKLITVTIAEKDIQTITADDVTAAYGDTDKRVSATTSGDGTITYAVKEGSEGYIRVDPETGVLTILSVPDGGKAYVTVTASETGTYAPAAKDVTVTITKGTPIVTEPKAKDLTYSGKAQELVTSGTTSAGVIKYALGENDTNAPEGGWDTSIPKGTAAGTYYVWYMVEGDEYYDGTDPKCVTVKIEPVAAEYTITFDLNGGSLDGQTGTVVKKYKGGTVITMPAPTRDGYTFDYWEGSAYYAGDKYTVSGDHTFKAVWKTSDSGKDDDTDDSDDSGSGGDGSDSGKSSSGKKGVKTGDENALTAWIALMLAAMAGTTGMVFVTRKRRD